MSPAPENKATETGGIPLAPGISALPSAIRFAFSRSSGPGGQNVNKVNTRAEIWVPLSALRGLPDDARQRLQILAGRRLTREGEIHLTAEASRTQEANRAAVMHKLRQLLIQSMRRPKKRRKTRPTAASQRKRLESKRHRGRIKAARDRRVETGD